LTVSHIYDILLSRDKDGKTKYPIDKGKPFERMGHKALEPNSPEGLMVVSCQKGNGRGFKAKPILRKENRLFLLF